MKALLQGLVAQAAPEQVAATIVDLYKRTIDRRGP